MFSRRSARHSKTSAPVAAPAPASAPPDGGELVYEVECILDPDVVAEFDAWLPGHVRDVLRSPGFLRAETLRPAEPGTDGKVRRINRYRVQDRASLDHYLEQLAPTLREDGARRFAGRASYQRRVLASEGAYLPSSAAEEAACANCGTPLYGHYCAECGQHARESARSLGTLFHDAWHVLTHIDGRFWQTLRRLAFSPGFLTNEYFAERRARYIPPFRLYIVVSLIFFFLASVSSLFDTETPIQLDGEGEQTVAELEKEAEGVANARRELVTKGAPGAVADLAISRAERELEAKIRAAKAREAAAAGESGASPTAPAAAAPSAAPATPASDAPAAATPDAPAAARTAATPPTTGSGPAADGESGSGSGRGFDPARCADLNIDPPWLARILQPGVRAACLRASQDGGRSLLSAINANIPKMMFVFLPLMAAVMLLLYWFPRRYYVEHLVFYLHVHAALFLTFSAVIVLGMLGNVVPPLESVVGLAGIAAFFYAVWYVWRAMRVHYRNGRMLTAVKAWVIFIAYVTCLSMTLVGTALLSAMSAA